MVQPQKNSSKDFAIELRKGGYSYSEIKKFCPVPKSTLSYWFRDLKLSEPQLARLKKKRIEATRRGSKTKTLKTFKAIEEIQNRAAKDIGKISKRELWLMGVVLYWRERNKNDFRKGVYFSSSNPELINFFLKWLKEVGGIRDEEIAFDIFTRKLKEDPGLYWSEITGFPKKTFSHVYIQKRASKGFLRIRVKASSMLARQVSGWAKGIEQYWDKQ